MPYGTGPGNEAPPTTGPGTYENPNAPPPPPTPPPPPNYTNPNPTYVNGGPNQGGVGGLPTVQSNNAEGYVNGTPTYASYTSANANPQNQQTQADTNTTGILQASNGMNQFNKNDLGLPSQAAYTPQNSAQNMAAIQGGYGLGQVANNGQVGNVNLGATTNYSG